jgi:hypothetical protein
MVEVGKLFGYKSWQGDVSSCCAREVTGKRSQWIRYTQCVFAADLGASCCHITGVASARFLRLLALGVHDRGILFGRLHMDEHCIAKSMLPAVCRQEM